MGNRSTKRGMGVFAVNMKILRYSGFRLRKVGLKAKKDERGASVTNSKFFEFVTVKSKISVLQRWARLSDWADDSRDAAQIVDGAKTFGINFVKAICPKWRKVLEIRPNNMKKGSGEGTLGISIKADGGLG